DAPLDDMPDGAFVLLADDVSIAWLVRGDRLYPWHASGYGAPCARPRGVLSLVLTPRPTVAVLRSAYEVEAHPSVEATIDR
ncbi:MAG: hypothetical protein ACREH6_03840, partial [Geminicoccaceae bacterium]